LLIRVKTNAARGWLELQTSLAIQQQNPAHKNALFSRGKVASQYGVMYMDFYLHDLVTIMTRSAHCFFFKLNSHRFEIDQNFCSEKKYNVTMSRRVLSSPKLSSKSPRMLL
jgi:hypothetical protein